MQTLKWSFVTIPRTTVVPQVWTLSRSGYRSLMKYSNFPSGYRWRQNSPVMW